MKELPGNEAFIETSGDANPFKDMEATGGARRYRVVDETVTLNRHQRRRLLAKKRKAKNKQKKGK